jgi:hypothetical protein
VGGHWWAERPDGSWVRWSWLKSDWEDRPSGPEEVEALRADSPPVLQAPPDPAAVMEREVHDAVVHWFALFAILVPATVGAFWILQQVLDLFLVVGFWGTHAPSILTPVLWVVGLGALICGTGLAVQVALIRRAGRTRAELAADPGRAAEVPLVERRLQGFGAVTAWVAATLVVILMLLAVWWSSR